MALPVKALKAGQEAYWLDQIARNREEYFSGRGESPGRFVGSAAQASGLEGLQQRPGGQLGARVSPMERRAALFPGGWVQALEHRPHLLRARGPLKAGCCGGAAHISAW